MRSRPRHVHASIPQHQVAFRTADKECIIPEAGIAGGYVVNIGQQRRSWSLHVFAQVSRSHHAAAKGSSVSSVWCSTVPWWTRTQKDSEEFLDGFPEDNKDRTNMWNNHVEEFHTSHNFRIHQSHQHQHRTPSISVVIWVTSYLGIALLSLRPNSSDSLRLLTQIAEMSHTEQIWALETAWNKQK